MWSFEQAGEEANKSVNAAFAVDTTDVYIF